METVLYFLARVVVALLQALPLTVVARLGRAAGALAYFASLWLLGFRVADFNRRDAHLEAAPPSDLES